MLYCEDWEKKKEKYLEFWARENHDRPLLSITAPKENRSSSIQAWNTERAVDGYGIRPQNGQLEDAEHLLSGRGVSCAESGSGTRLFCGLLWYGADIWREYQLGGTMDDE